MRVSKSLARTLALVLFALSLLGGCKRSEDAFDDRTLEKRPITETVRPEDRRDAFRP
ncbi:MAG: hypothetical protein NTW87_07735 [Planctomycetota bacterium]|nr:hypothetical protein [Planctomycetota bacterium]